MTDASIQGQLTVDLTNCDREPIHQIGAIQSVGFLVALSAEWLIVRLSANVPEHLGQPVTALLGRSFADIITTAAAHTISNRLSLLRGPDAVERAFAVQLQDGGALLDLAIHQAGQIIVIEAEPSQPVGELNAGSMTRSMLSRMQGKASMLQEAVRLVQALTGFDRVMIYRFHPDGSGEVVAERVRTGLEPFLGLHYPAEDIPSQARALLVRNPVRLLADVAAPPSPVISQHGIAGEPLDLSMSVLRAHSSMCIEYLVNMGVGATMTISLVRDGQLWGLISCHHMTARHVGFEQRTTVELFGQMLSFLIEKDERDEQAAYEERARSIHNRLVAGVIEKGSLGDNIVGMAGSMAELVPCDGFGLYAGGLMTLTGETPTRQEFGALVKFLERRESRDVYATEALSEVYPPALHFADRLAGLLAIPMSRSSCDYLVFFRNEIARSVLWAGQPGKVPVAGPNGVRLTPRKSFEAWQDIKRGHSTPWTKPELCAAEALRVTLLEVVLHLTGVTEKEARIAAQKQEVLIAELNHRVRNILALIRSLVSQTRTSAFDVNTFATILGDRVHALARAHDQITAGNWGPGSLATLIATEAEAYLGMGAARISAGGPPVLLHPQAFSTIALVIHELMTNAAKYGALTEPQGRVKIGWSVGAMGGIDLDWTEHGGPTVQPPRHRGFGTTIIERSVPHELGGRAMLDHAPGGTHAAFHLPSQHVVIDKRPIFKAVATVPAAFLPMRLSGAVLLVEDNIIIALDTENMLLALGASHVAVTQNVHEALRSIETETPSFALLDVNLGSEMSWPVATRLRELGVNYVFATGYGSGIEFPPEHRSSVTITKPYTSDSLARAASEAIQR